VAQLMPPYNIPPTVIGNGIAAVLISTVSADLGQNIANASAK